MNQPLIILGSARSRGNTRHLVNTIFQKKDHDLIDLNEHNINYYTYDNRHTDDDFIALAERMVQYDHIVFATPVYWYSMSAQLKTFFDRMTDLLTVRKDLGRKLKSKTLYSISCGSDGDLPEGFIVPFEATAVYLDMRYGGHFQGWVEHDEIPPEVHERITNFTKNIFKG